MNVRTPRTRQLQVTGLILGATFAVASVVGAQTVNDRTAFQPLEQNERQPTDVDRLDWSLTFAITPGHEDRGLTGDKYRSYDLELNSSGGLKVSLTTRSRGSKVLFEGKIDSKAAAAILDPVGEYAKSCRKWPARDQGGRDTDARGVSLEIKGRDNPAPGRRMG